ncbi:MAG: NAD-dependent protein deacetylase [Granulosicoccus sp.]
MITPQLSQKTDALDRQLASIVVSHPRLMVLTGAGISTAAGLNDYRNKQGQWKRQRPLTGQVFVASESARKRYWARSSVGWPSFSLAQPAASHFALREMQKSGIVQFLVTQNVDRLHQKAGHQDVVDLHGALETVSCIACSNTVSRDDFQIQLLDANSWLTSLSADYAPDGDADLELDSLEQMQIPDCPQCGNLLKPDVVFFGESVPRTKVQNSMQQLSAADALLVAGSSLMVYSGYRFCKEAHQSGKPIIIINDGVTRADAIATIKVGGDCGSRLTTLAQLSRR